jgi:hypothetical protein
VSRERGAEAAITVVDVNGRAITDAIGALPCTNFRYDGGEQITLELSLRRPIVSTCNETAEYLGEDSLGGIQAAGMFRSETDQIGVVRLECGLTLVSVIVSTRLGTPSG